MNRFLKIVSSFGIVLATASAEQTADVQELISNEIDGKSPPSLYYQNEIDEKETSSIYQHLTTVESDENMAETQGNGACYNGSCK